MYALVEGVLLDRRGEERGQGATAIDQQLSAVKLWHAMEMLPPVAAISYKEVEAVGH